MAENRWIISDISKKTNLEAHVLRYWEKELDLQIPRNELGHRYYLDCHVDIFNKIHELKEAGYQLKAIKSALNNNGVPVVSSTNNIITMPTTSSRQQQSGQTMQVVNTVQTTVPTPTPTPMAVEPVYKQTGVGNTGDKMEQFKQILSEVMLETINEHGKDMGIQISDRVIKQMDYLMRMQEELEDERFRRLDETIRSYQKDRQNAATYNKENKKSLFKRKPKGAVGHI